MAKKTKIAIADDHGVVRDGLKMIINGFEGFEVIFAVENGVELLKQLEKMPGEDHPEICIIDISMPEMDGYETMRQLSERFAGIKVLSLSMFYNEFSIIKMLRLGAKGYIKKDADSEELLKAMQIIGDGGYYHPGVPVEKLYRKLSSARSLMLSEKEMEFLRYCCLDLGYKEIAELMKVSVRTVDNYRNALFAKLNIRTRIGLTIYALKSGLAGNE